MDETDPRAALLRLAADVGESLASLSRLLGRNEAYLHQFVTRGSPRRLAEDDRRRLAAYFGVRETVLGGPARGSAGTAAALMLPVRRLDVAAAAGAGGLSETDGDDGAVQLDVRLLPPALRRRAAGMSMIRVTGDSMSPTLEHGDHVLVDPSRRMPGADAAIHVLRVDGALVVKRLSRHGDMLDIRSDNPAWPTLSLPAAQADVIGRVVWLSRALD